MARASRSVSGLRGLAVGLGLAALVGCATPQILSGSGPIGDLGSLPAIAVQAPIGLPAPKATRLADGLIDSLRNRGVSLAPSASAPARYALQGFCSATAGGGTTSFVCVWDLNANSGERAQRIVTEEQVAGGTANDPYAVVGNATLDRVADTVTSKVAGWLSSAPASDAPLISLPRLFGSDRPPPVAIAAISGAPGDGNRALAEAMGGALREHNVPVSSGGSNAYRLSGRVAMSDAGGGDQTVVIEWELADPSGISLGVITQRNQVPKGALDGRWGRTAEDAARAAAGGVVQLLPERG